MTYVLMFMPPVVAIIVLIIALKNGFNKEAFFASCGVTMVINMFTMHYVTWYGLICTITIPFAFIYVMICLVLSVSERRKK